MCVKILTTTLICVTHCLYTHFHVYLKLFISNNSVVTNTFDDLLTLNYNYLYFRFLHLYATICWMKETVSHGRNSLMG